MSGRRFWCNQFFPPALRFRGRHPLYRSLSTNHVTEERHSVVGQNCPNDCRRGEGIVEFRGPSLGTSDVQFGRNETWNQFVFGGALLLCGSGIASRSFRFVDVGTTYYCYDEGMKDGEGEEVIHQRY